MKNLKYSKTVLAFALITAIIGPLVTGCGDDDAPPAGIIQKPAESEVKKANEAPVLKPIGMQIAQAGQTFSMKIRALDTPGDELFYYVYKIKPQYARSMSARELAFFVSGEGKIFYDEMKQFYDAHKKCDPPANILADNYSAAQYRDASINDYSLSEETTVDNKLTGFWNFAWGNPVSAAPDETQYFLFVAKGSHGNVISPLAEDGTVQSTDIVTDPWAEESAGLSDDDKLDCNFDKGEEDPTEAEDIETKQAEAIATYMANKDAEIVPIRVLGDPSTTKLAIYASNKIFPIPEPGEENPTYPPYPDDPKNPTKEELLMEDNIGNAAQRSDGPTKVTFDIAVLDWNNTTEPETAKPLPSSTTPSFNFFNLDTDPKLPFSDEASEASESKVGVFPSQPYTLLMLDLSGSVTQSDERVSELTEAAKQFVDILVNAGHKIAIYYFTDETERLANFTPKNTEKAEVINRFHESLDNLSELAKKNAGAATNLYGAIIDGLDTLEEEYNGADADSFAGSLVVFSDGVDTFEEYTLDNVTTALNSKTNSLFYVHFIDQNPLENEDPKGPGYFLGRYKFETEATASDADLKEKFISSAHTVRDIAKGHYTIAYCPPSNTPGSFGLKVTDSLGRQLGYSDNLAIFDFDPEEVDNCMDALEKLRKKFNDFDSDGYYETPALYDDARWEPTHDDGRWENKPGYSYDIDDFDLQRWSMPLCIVDDATYAPVDTEVKLPNNQTMTVKQVSPNNVYGCCIDWDGDGYYNMNDVELNDERNPLIDKYGATTPRTDFCMDQAPLDCNDSPDLLKNAAFTGAGINPDMADISMDGFDQDCNDIDGPRGTDDSPF